MLPNSEPCLNFESMCRYMDEKFGDELAKKSGFSKQMEFRKRSNMRIGSKKLVRLFKAHCVVYKVDGSKEQELRF